MLNVFNALKTSNAVTTLIQHNNSLLYKALEVAIYYLHLHLRVMNTLRDRQDTN